MRAALIAIAALGALATTACHHGATAQASAEKITTTTASAPYDAGAAVRLKDTGACASITSARAAAIAVTVDGALQNCMITKQGAWGAVVTSATPGQFVLGSSQITLAFAHASGSNVLLGDHEYWVNVGGLSLFDFDGDGEEELIVQGAHRCMSSSDGACGQRQPDNEILTFHSGKVVPYLSAAVLPIPAGLTQSLIYLKNPTHFDETDHTLHIAEVADVDGDGRPDLKTDLYYEMDVSDGDVSSTTLEGPTFVAHSLPNGTFSLTDAVAMKALAANCAGIDSFEKSPSLGLFPIAICARLHGKGVAEISQRYTARCAQIRAKYKQIMKNSAAGKKTPEDTDYDAEFACRTEPEQGWSEVNGIPKAVVKMLQMTQPLLASSLTIGNGNGAPKP